MKIQYFTDPWTYCVIDDLFDKSEYDTIKNFIYENHKNIDDGIKVVKQDDLPQYTYSDKLISNDSLPQNIISIFKHKNIEIYENVYKHLWDHTDNKLVKQKFNPYLNDVKNKIDFVMCGKDYNYPIHTDISSKRLSSVFYGGLIGDGTVLCSSESLDNISKVVEWKSNRCLTFIPQKNSWHFYGNYSNEIRYTFNMLFVKSENIFY